LTIGFDLIYLTSKNGFEGCRILLCVNLKDGKDNWGLMWYRMGLNWRERELDIEEEVEEEEEEEEEEDEEKMGFSEESLLT
jgi:hypothetical protein